MISGYFQNYLTVALFLCIGLAVPIIAFWLSSLLQTKRPSSVKMSTYECGMEPFGDSRIQFNIRYYLFALIFIIFDIETVFLYPWAVAFNQLGLFAFIEMIIFIAILAVGLIYAWRKKVLEWS